MGAVLECSAEKYLDSARRTLKEKDLLGFVENITSSILLSQQDAEMLANATYLKVEGLMSLKQHSKALEAIDLALSCNTAKEKVFHLLKFKGKAKGYLGYADEALQVFKDLLTDITDNDLKVVIYLYIAWVHLTVDKEKNVSKLEEAKLYLDLAITHFTEMPSNIKWRICNNLSVYYFYLNEYDSSIKALDDAIQYCEEKDLPDVYINLAELYLKSDEVGVATCIDEYLRKAEIIATKYKNNIALGYTFYTKAMAELRENHILAVLDTLYLSFEFFREAEAHTCACDCLIKINELMDDYKTSRLNTLKGNFKEKLTGTQYFGKIK